MRKYFFVGALILLEAQKLCGPKMNLGPLFVPSSKMSAPFNLAQKSSTQPRTKKRVYTVIHLIVVSFQTIQALLHILPNS